MRLKITPPLCECGTKMKKKISDNVYAQKEAVGYYWRCPNCAQRKFGDDNWTVRPRNFGIEGKDFDC